MFEIKIPRKEKGRHVKVRKQEAKSARQLLGRTTIGSGNLPFDKADVYIQRARTNFDPKSYRIECKRTDKKSIKFQKAWIDKLKRETNPKEFWALELEIQDEQLVCIPKNDFRFLCWILTAPRKEILKEFSED